ncbi:MAG: hypothetical protein CL853_04100 [Crocinitomicaceae bacterium]|nr:hypothetical protein [Crocinitomicaceae bacterium]|tara:strand:+ start:2070 stop:3344 length:1275 start_codon:yes stop_codon:yes gene_type:complete
MNIQTKIVVLCLSWINCLSGNCAFNPINNTVLEAFKKSSIELKGNYPKTEFSQPNFLEGSWIDYKQYYVYFTQKEIKKTTTLFNWKSTKCSFINQILTQNSVPKQFSVLPILLSGGNSSYKNKNGGVGIWGLNYPSAKRYGLQLNQFVDERCLDSLSTIAAAKHLNHLLSIYNQNIDYTFLAYISSPSLVNKAIKRANHKSLDSVLLKMGGNYMDWLKAFHALAKINNQFIITHKKETHTVLAGLVLEKPLLFEAINHSIDFNTNRFQELNPQIRKNKIPENYTIFLDSVEHQNLLDNLDSIYFFQDSVLLNPFFNEAFEFTKMLVYKVRSGDYLGKIAELYEVTVGEIQSWNELNSTRINVGQELIIYTPDSDTTKYFVYKVKEGDSLGSIAKKFPGVTVDSLKQLNPNQPIKPGQLLKLKKK